MTPGAPSAGELRHVVTVQSQAATLGDRGQKTAAWTSQTPQARAKIETLSGREGENARQLYASASLQVTMRYWPGLTPQHRLLFGSRVLEIGHVDNLEQRDEWHVVLCSESKTP